MSKSSRPFGRDVELFDTSLGWRFVNPRMRDAHGVDSMGQTAENVAERLGIAREAQDLFACGSQQKAAAARARGRFALEIAPVEVPAGRRGTVQVEQDEFLRPETTLEGLAKLRPAFRTDGQGSVTAGNASGLNDGACALLIASEAACREIGAEPLARVVTTAVAGVEPRVMGLGPVPATRRALAQAGLGLDDLDVLEFNEAFAAQVLGGLQELGMRADDPRLNPNGGAIALGHPLGMRGARLLLTAAHELRAGGGRYALATMCVGVGQGMATVLERV
jgi:acetyl-CoA acetyltransferase family protein